jgi:hypothetical protein
MAARIESGAGNSDPNRPDWTGKYPLQRVAD